ncbi:Phage protein Gp37/Gp68 [Alicyclobacillus macrosporangiidus]|uniref:Phage protein Gp37/Gp68 n=2 Tax=Alicyclobacillus macrosporangiidus TaxID=392015 RepID=A0A1I7LE80_9BACL|nr:Phage protein Gp37/Gp68 [Alicyclobacillus macrosporangiidus]
MQAYFTERQPNELVRAWAKAVDTLVVLDDPDVLFSEYVEGVTAHDWDHNRLNSSGSEYRPFGYLKRVWPLPNVWLGVSVENQDAADERIPLLLETPAAVRFLSCEPLLGPVDITKAMYGSPDGDGMNWFGHTDGFGHEACLHWVIVGGESGPNARPMHPDWVLSLRDQCQDAGVPFFFKQWGEFVPVDWVRAGSSGFPVRRVGKKAAGRMLDGRTWDEYPEARVNAE